MLTLLTKHKDDKRYWAGVLGAVKRVGVGQSCW